MTAQSPNPQVLGPGRLKWCNENLKGFKEAYEKVEASRKDTERVRKELIDNGAIIQENTLVS